MNTYAQQQYSYIWIYLNHCLIKIIAGDNLVPPPTLLQRKIPKGGFHLNAIEDISVIGS